MLLFRRNLRLIIITTVRCQSSSGGLLLPRVTKLKSVEKFARLLTPELCALREIFDRNRRELKIAGGAVRDLVLDIQPCDVDLATDARPQEMLEIFKRENVRVINLNGIKHGTVPVRINDKTNYEITTLRVDVKTYGRHAEVEFTNDWHLDAIRRDLTINALFLDFEGNIYDYVNGVEDIERRVVRFVGVPDRRVKEDYLRIMRYFRFYSRIRPDCNDHHRESIEAIRNNVEGLQKISGERIGSELRKILDQPFADSFMHMFYDLGLWKYLGFPQNGNIERFSQVYRRLFTSDKTRRAQPFTALTALMTSESDIEAFHQRIHLSKHELHTMHAIRKYESNPTFSALIQTGNKQKLLNFIMQEMSRSRAVLSSSPLERLVAIELLKYSGCNDELIETVREIRLPPFRLGMPQINNHVIPHGTTVISLDEYSKSVRKIRFNGILNELKTRWIDSEFKLTNEELLAQIDEEFVKQFLRDDKKSKNQNKN